MKIILSGGGTAGHVNPAVAIAEEIIRDDPCSKILFIGRHGGKENQQITRAGFSLHTLNVSGLKRKITKENLSVIKNAIEARKEAEKIISDFKPDIILVTGGYVCWPVLSAGQKLGVPTAIHESNVTPGLATKLLARKCKLVLLGYESAGVDIRTKGKICTIGTPVRADFTRIERSDARRKLKISDNDFFILSFGGSIGAERLNEAVIKMMKDYSSKKESVIHLHATGERYFEQFKNQSIFSENERCRILPYISDMPLMMKAADIVITRCGAMTLSEIAQVGVAAILIPSPNVSGNHQFKNAKHLCDSGAADMIEEKHLTAEKLIEVVSRLKNDKIARKNRAKKARTFSYPNAAKEAVKELKMLKNVNNW
jgi:UDP-N-acetylglucosamine--N-acetylmuramyl-(pentapeptide) pyrophosphoryl-undecaprenol N-acetylglucosamine transferase